MKTSTKQCIFLAVVIAVFIFGTSFQHAYAQSSLQNQIKQNKQKHSKLWQRVKELSEDKRELGDQIALVDQRIEEKSAEIEAIQQQLDQANARHEQLLNEQQQIAEQLAECKKNVADRARAIYMQGELTYLDILFQSSSVGDLIDRVFFVQAVLDNDQMIISEAQRKSDEMEEKLKAVEVQKEEIERIKEQIELQLADLEGLKGDKELTMAAIQSDAQLALRQIEELERENNRIKQELRERANSADAYKGSWTGSFAKPCPGGISSGFGMRIHPIYKRRQMHTGVDIKAPSGTSVKAAGQGKVIYTGRRGGYGLCVMVDHGIKNGKRRVTLYAHLSKITCDAGDSVNTNSVIGKVGTTGTSTGPHLHFEVRLDGEPVDPMKAMN
jgi:murein DD-endopeptidase MepM/ murein hydrolase activator NlpD